MSKTTVDAQKLTPEEACRRARAEAIFIETHRAKLATKREKLLDKLATSDLDERESIGAEISTLSASEMFADHAVATARDSLRALAPLAVRHLVGLVETLSALHLQAGELVRKQVEQSVHGALAKKGWWTLQELHWLIPRSQPMRAQYFFEQEHFASLGIALVSTFDQETQAGGQTLSGAEIDAPAGFIGAEARLLKSIEAATRRRDELANQGVRQ